MAINPKDLSKESLEINSNLKLFQIYKNLKHVSLKCDTYFQVYEEMFNRYVGKKITFVEIGVLHGGSLFMWREYFGKNARIIGITVLFSEIFLSLNIKCLYPSRTAISASEHN